MIGGLPLQAKASGPRSNFLESV